ncbi:MAG: CfrBI family restriction endonuclease [Candidatus Omnitrophica bacterium]|nr:CfrBI family restriction endonuclease [Candidatus Omnitrophota bacterium]
MPVKVSIPKLMPVAFRELVESKGADLIRQVGEETIRQVVSDIFCGVNVRASTESLTRQRIGKLNAATLLLYLRGLQVATQFSRELPSIAARGLSRRAPKAERWLYQWMLGLTEKGFQNVLRDDVSSIGEYAKTFAVGLRALAKGAGEEHGDLTCRVRVDKNREVVLDWHDLLSLFCTIGSQTLAIRGSEKSTYGKLFERLVLGSVLSVFDFKQTAVPPKKLAGVFWLSSKVGEREADATLLIAPGQAIRFDLGFIGRGNPEITKDKISRFERDLEMNRARYHSMTVIIVDRVGESSGLKEQAKRAGATIIQMSMSHWPKHLAKLLADKFGYRHKLLSQAPADLPSFYRRKLARVHFEDFIRGFKTTEDMAS